MLRLKIAAAWIGLQVVFFIGWASVEEARLGEGVGESIVVRVTPVDPRDLLRGQFIRLAYEFSWPDSSFVAQSLPAAGSTVWVVLRREGELHVPKEALAERPERLALGEVALRGRVLPGRFMFGIESYFVPEGTETPDWQDLTVRLRVGRDGRPRIEQVYLRGVPWPE
jgi:uncharacterized membrane-anchored protein